MYEFAIPRLETAEYLVDTAYADILQQALAPSAKKSRRLGRIVVIRSSSSALSYELEPLLARDSDERESSIGDDALGSVKPLIEVVAGGRQVEVEGLPWP
jgi:hypothetical protein